LLGSSIHDNGPGYQLVRQKVRVSQILRARLEPFYAVQAILNGDTEGRVAMVRLTVGALCKQGTCRQ